MVDDKVKLIQVTGAIIQKRNKFLICKRGPKEKASGFWEFPGGKLEKNEKLEHCIRRELKEELDIDAVIGDLYDHYIYKSKDVKYDLYFFKILSFRGKLKLSVHDDLKWVELKNFSNYTFLPGDGPLIDKLIEDESLHA